MMPGDQSGEITITRFELTSKPSLHVPAPARQLALIRAHDPPPHFYRYLLGQLGHTLLQLERSDLDDADLAQIIHDEGVELYVLYVEGVPAGLGELDLRQAPEAQIACSELMRDFMDPPLRRYLLAQMITIAWSHGIERLTSAVTSLDHQGALSTYQACGFTVYDQAVMDRADVS